VDERKRYTAEEKAQMMREIVEDGKTVSLVAEERGISPTNIFKWRKQLIENAPHLFESKRPDITNHAAERRAAALEEKLRHKDEVIAELAAELLALKKKNSGL
jgi:transposase